MKIDDIEFGPHPSGLGSQARVDFDNGYGASIIMGEWFYTDDDHPYEVGVLCHGKLTYETHITDDVEGYCDEDRVNKLLTEIEALPPVDKGRSGDGS